MAIGGSPTSTRITAWHHTCCDTVRWSAQRTCDLCGTEADYWHKGVPVSVVMARLYHDDMPQRTVAAPTPSPAGGNPSPVVTRPPGARPHRPHEEDEEPPPAPPRPLLTEGWSAVPTMRLAGAIALASALAAAASLDQGEAPIGLLLVSLAAMLVVVLAPVVTAGRPAEPAR
ncbi:MAG: hypothetical protein IT177_07470 [Acidobacteria bacterium]|nr:hypothetical protein [Acidobacteriota bacterium]